MKYEASLLHLIIPYPNATRLTIQTSEPTLQELKIAIEKLKTHKAAGPENIPSGILKAC